MSQSDAPNNFDAIRIVAAFTVLYSHQFALTGRPEPSFFGLHSWGGLAVIVFFVVSGFLVTGSWYNDPSVLRFGARRVLRLWPALTTVTVLTAYGLGAWVTTLPLEDYWKNRATLDYLNILRMQIYYVLPGVFEHNPYPRGVNGSLWTIPLEVRCYVVLALAGLLRLMRWRSAWLACIALYMAWFIAKSSADITGHVHYGRELGAFFLAGSALFVLREHWEHRPRAWLLGLGGVAALLWALGWRYTATLAFIPLLVLYAGTRSTPVLRRFGRFGDPSYGAYLIAFPVQQTVIHFLYPSFDFTATLIMATGLTFALAYASWHVIEKPALRLKPRRRPPSPLQGGDLHPSGHGAPFKPSRAGLPLAILSCMLAIAAQTSYAVQAYTDTLERLAQILPAVGAALLLCAALALAGRVRHTLLRRGLQTALVAAALAFAITTLVAAIGYLETGTIPRVQQLHGLTWDIVGPSILEIARGHAIALALGLALLVPALLLLRLLLRRARRLPIRLAPLAALGLALLATGLWAARQGASQDAPFIATQLFQSDLDAGQVLSEQALQAEARFFNTYRHDLAETEAAALARHPRPIAGQQRHLAGAGIGARQGHAAVWRRRRHAPLHAGARAHDPARSPVRARPPVEQGVHADGAGALQPAVLGHLCQQPAVDVSKDGLAAHLDRLGYSTTALSNTDANYDNNELFQKLHGYRHTMYRQAINPGSPNADDLKLLEHAERTMGKARAPFYMMLWPIQTHHPYGREYWSREWEKHEPGQ
jgi:peptidoglycan/LPS O-acetylase OafA/YrhL